MNNKRCNLNRISETEMQVCWGDHPPGTSCEWETFVKQGSSPDIYPNMLEVARANGQPDLTSAIRKAFLWDELQALLKKGKQEQGESPV